MKIFNKLKGDYGEDLAAEYLKKNRLHRIEAKLQK